MASMISSWSPEKKHSEVERWICIYPAYINSKKTLAQGRKLPKSSCVENPTHQEIRDVLVTTGLKVGVENKLYPREQSKKTLRRNEGTLSINAQLKTLFLENDEIDIFGVEMLYRGRIRIHLKNDDGTPVKQEFPTRESVMKYIGESIPKLKTRQNRPADQPAQPTQTANKGNKGKKGRR